MKLLLAAALALAAPVAALEVPYLSGRVVDDARLFDGGSSAALEAKLKAYEAKTGRQIAVLTLNTLDGEALEDFSIKVARTWKLGHKGKNDGILVLVAKDDHKVRIEVGYGLEGSLPDAAAGRIVRDQMVPKFRSGDYAGGIDAGVDAVIGTLDGTYAPPADDIPEVRVRGGSSTLGDDLLEKLMISFFVFGILGLFEFIGMVAPEAGGFMYFFLIPFWAAFPMAIWGAKVGLTILIAHLVGFPLLRMILPKTEWGKKFGKGMGKGGSGGGFVGGSSWSSGSDSGSSFDSGGFSGGGGDFGGGGASGSW